MRIHTAKGFEYHCHCGFITHDLDNYEHHVCNVLPSIYKIPNASIQKIIGVESNSTTNETYHHITIIIYANKIDPKDYEEIPTKGNVEIKI